MSRGSTWPQLLLNQLAQVAQGALLQLLQRPLLQGHHAPELMGAEGRPAQVALVNQLLFVGLQLHHQGHQLIAQAGAVVIKAEGLLQRGLIKAAATGDWIIPRGRWCIERFGVGLRPVVKQLLQLLGGNRLAMHAQTLRQLRDEIQIEWIEALPAQVDTRGLDTLQRRKRLVDQACELMLARSDEPLSILEVCSQVGISRRKLNYCFHDVLGTTPVKYLRAVRLNGVRRDLKRAAPAQTVQDIATRWGFWHLSQFAQDYRRLFGELPSATLKGPR